jgi:8-oxo-dGTP pyrophosphatase MutT (NUDIX family)
MQDGLVEPGANAAERRPVDTSQRQGRGTAVRSGQSDVGVEGREEATTGPRNFPSQRKLSRVVVRDQISEFDFDHPRQAPDGSQRPDPGQTRTAVAGRCLVTGSLCGGQQQAGVRQGSQSVAGRQECHVQPQLLTQEHGKSQPGQPVPLLRTKVPDPQARHPTDYRPGDPRAAGSLARVPTPEFVATLRAHVGHDSLWLSTATGVVLDDNDRVLLGRRSDTGGWALPGGIIDPAEEPADAAVREILEETGVVAVPDRLVAVNVLPPMTYPNGDQVRYLDLAFRCRPVGGKARVNDSESLEVGWHPLAALPTVSRLTLTLLAHATSGKAEAAFAFSGIDRQQAE